MLATHLNGAAQAEWVEFLWWRVRVRIIQTAQTAQRKCVAKCDPSNFLDGVVLLSVKSSIKRRSDRLPGDHR